MSAGGGGSWKLVGEAKYRRGVGMWQPPASCLTPFLQQCGKGGAPPHRLLGTPETLAFSPMTPFHK